MKVEKTNFWGVLFYVFVFIKLFDYSLIIILLILFFSVKKVSTIAHWYFVISLGCVCDTFTFAKAKVWDFHSWLYSNQRFEQSLRQTYFLLFMNKQQKLGLDSFRYRYSRDDVLGAFLCIILWRKLFRFLYNFNLVRKFIFN